MDDPTHLLLLVLLDLGLLLGLLAIPIGIGGNFIVLALALIVALVTHFTAIGWAALAIMGGAVLVGEILETLLGALMARRFGASRWGMIGAIVGGLLGAVVGTAILPVIGSLIGSFVGSAAGAIGAELLSGRGRSEGLRAGWGAFLGKGLATALKMAIGVGMAVHIVQRTH